MDRAYYFEAGYRTPRHDAGSCLWALSGGASDLLNHCFPSGLTLQPLFLGLRNYFTFPVQCFVGHMLLFFARDPSFRVLERAGNFRVCRKMEPLRTVIYISLLFQTPTQTTVAGVTLQSLGGVPKWYLYELLDLDCLFTQKLKMRVNQTCKSVRPKGTRAYSMHRL